MVLAAGPRNDSGNSEAAGGAYRVESPVVARVAGLPASVLAPLRMDASWALVEQLLGADAALEREGSDLGQALFDHIGALSTDPVKPRLVALRRAVHNRRTPGEREWNEEIAAALPGELAKAVHQWLGQLGGRQRLLVQLRSVLNSEYQDKVPELRAAVAHPMFQHALLHASPALFDEVRKWLADGRRSLRRRTLVGLARFLSRAAAKTSPFSTFTYCALGTWTEVGPAVRFRGDLDVRGVVELDRRVLGRVVRALERRPGLRAELPVRLNPSATVAGKAVTFLGPWPEEPILSLPLSPALSECMRVASAAPGTLAQLSARLSEELAADPADLLGYLDKLVECGLLNTSPAVPDQSSDPLDGLLRWLESIPPVDEGHSAAIALIGDLRRILDHGVETGDIAAGLARRDGAARAMAGLETALDLPSTPPELLRKRTFHETAMFTNARVQCSLASWRPALDDLNVVRSWLAVHDWLLPTRLALGTYVRRRFGAGASVPFPMLHRAVQQDLALPESQCPPWLAATRPFLRPSTPVWPHELEQSTVPRIAELYQLRLDSARTVLAVPEHDGVLRVDPRELADLAGSWPSWVRPTASIACYLQPFLVEDDLRVVVNMVAGGYGRGRARWLRLAAQSGSVVPEWQYRTSTAPDLAVAELSGTFDASVNLRTPLAPLEVDYPFTASDRPAAQRIPLCELVVVHEPDADLLDLVDPRRGIRVRPAHLGMMGDPLLPPAIRLLLTAFGPSHLVNPSAPTVYPLEEQENETEVYRLPRVEVGRVVLQRTRWIVAAASVPARENGGDEADHLLRLAGWLRSHGIPDRCYVRVLEPEGEWADQLFAKSRKPVFVDFANPFLLLTFEHLLADRTGQVVFEEPLPVPELGCCPDPATPSVTEFIVELSTNEG